MEMDSAQLNNDGDYIKDAYAELLHSPNFHIIDEERFGDPEVLPRVGDDYQVKIPPLMSESEYVQLTNKQIMAGFTHEFAVGLTMPIMRVNEEVQEIKHELPPFHGVLNDMWNNSGLLESARMTEKGESSGAIVEHERFTQKGECSGVEVGVLNDMWNNSGLLESARMTEKGESSGAIVEHERFTQKGECSGVEVQPAGIALDCRTRLGELAQLQQDNNNNNNRLQVQCGVSLGKSWSEIEEASFLLGVYIFGKNFDRVKRFIENKKMGELLSFYYGRFYGSDRYHKWIKKYKRRMYGPKIFAGLRHKEFLSRLLPRVSEDCHSTLQEVSKTFGEGNMSLEEYVFTVKSMVGMNNLIEAVGIGRKKLDLTRITKEALRSSQGFPVRPEIPSGKACATLKAEEIIKFLTGDFRLSKARSNDLFWEAVWPRLLARGWHSEQPMDRVYAVGSKHSLVFLMPGVKKFSRKKLVKGDQYFDSVSDVLGKVASDPRLIELEIEAEKGNGSNGLTDDEKLEQDDLSDQQRHRYLQPRTPKHSSNLAKITVVDTSLVDGEKFKVREVRSLQIQTLKTCQTRSHSEEIDSNSSEEATAETGSANVSCFKQKVTDNPKPTRIILDVISSSDRKDVESYASYRGFTVNGRYSTTVPSKTPMDHGFEMCNDMHTRKARKCQSSQKMSLEKSINLAPVTKRRRRLTACSRAEARYSSNGVLVSPRGKQEKAHEFLGNPDACETSIYQVDPSQEKSSSTNCLSKNSLIENNDDVMDNGHVGAEHPHEKPQLRMLIDLNIAVPPDPEQDEPLMMELAEKQEDQTRKHQDDPQAPDTSAGGASSEQQTNMNSRRQSTRNRPLTSKALEALANGYLSVKQRQKRGESSPREKSNSRPSKRACGRMEIIEHCSAGFGDSKVKEEDSEVCTSNSSIFQGQS